MIAAALGCEGGAAHGGYFQEISTLHLLKAPELKSAKQDTCFPATV
jgi:hypothetical protein